VPNKEDAITSTIDVQKISASEIKKLWTAISREDWISILKSSHSGGKWSSQRESIKGCCPFHSDRTPSFHVFLQKGYAKCFSSSCNRYFWNPVTLYAELNNLSYSNALSEIKTKYNPKGLPHRTINALKKIDAHRRMKKVLFNVTQKELIDSSKSSNEEKEDLAYANPIVAYLGQRKIHTDVLHHLPLGVLPPQLRLEKKMDEYLGQSGEDKKIIKHAVEYLSSVYTGTDWIGSLLFFYGADPYNVSRIKVRMIPHQTQDADSPEQKMMMFLPDNMGLDHRFTNRPL